MSDKKPVEYFSASRIKKEKSSFRSIRNQKNSMGNLVYKSSGKQVNKTVYNPAIHNQQRLTTNVQNTFEKIVNTTDYGAEYLNSHKQLQIKVDGNTVQTYFGYNNATREVKIINYHHEGKGRQ